MKMCAALFYFSLTQTNQRWVMMLTNHLTALYVDTDFAGASMKFLFSLFLAISINLSTPITQIRGSHDLAYAGIVSSAIRATALAWFGKVLIKKGSKLARDTLLQMIKNDPKLLEHIIEEGVKKVAKNPRLRKQVDDFIAEARAVARYDKVIEVPRSKYPQTAKHMDDSVDAGLPRALEIFRPGAKANRRDALKGHKTQKGADRDEYPPAMTKEGGTGSSVRYIDPSDNRGAGACVGVQCAGLPDGSRILLDTID